MYVVFGTVRDRLDLSDRQQRLVPTVPREEIAMMTTAAPWDREAAVVTKTSTATASPAAFGTPLRMASATR